MQTITMIISLCHTPLLTYASFIFRTLTEPRDNYLLHRPIHNILGALVIHYTYTSTVFFGDSVGIVAG